MNKITINSDTRDELLSASDSERALPYWDFAFWVSVVKGSGGKAAAARLRVWLHAMKPSEGLNENFVHLNFSKDSEAGNLVKILT